MQKKQIYDDLELKNKLVPRPIRMYILICIVGLITVSIVGYGFFKGDRMVKMYAPLIDATMEIKSEATTAHLWFEEIISGDRNEDIGDVWKHLDQAEWYATAMLKGGKNQAGAFIPLDDADLRTKIKTVQEKLKEFRGVAQKRIETRELSGVGTDIDQRYDAIFRNFCKKADEVETKLQQIMVNDLISFRYTQVFLIVISILLFLTIGISFWYFDNKRVKNLLLLNQVNKALKKSEESLSITLASIGDAVIATDIEGRISRMNPVAEHLTGWTLEEALGIALNEAFNIVNAHTKKPAANPVRQVLETGKIVGLANHTMLISKNGSKYQIADSAAPIQDDTGNILGVVLVFRDVTEEYQMRKALQESEEKYRSMMEAMDDAAYICSSEYLIEYMNSAMIKKTGRDATGELCHKVIHGLDEKCPWCIHGKIMNSEYINYEILSPKDDKAYHVSNSPIFHTDESISVLTIFRDITEFKKMETQLQQSQKMESIGTLAGGIAHDFNNILFPIIGHTEMLLQDVPEDSPFRDSLNGIYTSALRARNLVKQILTFSRQDTNELKLMKMQPIIKEALKLIRSSIPTTIEIKQNINADCGVIKADPTQIHQIVMNLSTNAYHAMEDTGGELIVSLKEMELGELDLITPDMTSGVYACLTIADTGVGMDKILTDKIFDPFFTTKETGKGTGMGLSVVHGIVTSMDGVIQVHSKPGEGTQFHVYLPVEKSLSEKPATHSKAEIHGGIEQVLLVDDEEAILTMEKKMLERLGYQVTSRTSSVEALEAFRDSPDRFDLVITDMAMPNMSGHKLSAELIKIRPDVPVLLCTGFSEAMSEEKAASLGIKGFLLKPIVMTDLSQKIREVLDDK